MNLLGMAPKAPKAMFAIVHACGVQFFHQDMTFSPLFLQPDVHDIALVDAVADIGICRFFHFASVQLSHGCREHE